jgi:hypothetical protein
MIQFTEPNQIHQSHPRAAPNNLLSTAAYTWCQKITTSASITKMQPLQVRDRGREGALAIMVITAAMFCVCALCWVERRTIQIAKPPPRASDKWSRPSVCVPKTAAWKLEMCARVLLLIIKLVTCARRALCDSPPYLSVSFGCWRRCAAQTLVCQHSQHRRFIFICCEREAKAFLTTLISPHSVHNCLSLPYFIIPQFV